MTERDALDVFPTEYRHEMVVKFIKDLMEGNIKLVQPQNLESANTYANLFTDLSRNINKFFSGKLKGEAIEAVESDLFELIAMMRTSNMIYETTSQTKIEKEIMNLHNRINSTNTLLLEILKELRGDKNK